MALVNINPIQWHDGMLLMPQHFQQTDLRMDKIVSYYISNLSNYFWGIVNLKVDDAVLTTGTFRLIELEAILPDGLLIPELSDAISLELDLIPYQNQLQNAPQYIYLCIPHRERDGINANIDLPRYISQMSTNILDINSSSQSIDIPRLTPNLSLQIGQQPPAHFVSLPIAQVVFDTKSFSQTNYLPPEVRTNLSTGIGAVCNDLGLRLRQKLGYLQQKVQAVKDSASKGVFSEEIEGIRLKLIAGLLPFEATLFLGNAHPFELYRALCGLAGMISGVQYGEMPPRFDPYDHFNLNSSFQQVIDYINTVLDEIEESYSIVPFTLTDRIFSLQLQSKWVGDRLVLGAKIQPNMTTDDILNWIQNCVIVTDQHVTSAKDNRVLGASRKAVSEVPSMNLIATKGIQLFIVDVDPTYIDPKGLLCLFNISDDEMTRPLEIVLYNTNQ